MARSTNIMSKAQRAERFRINLDHRQDDRPDSRARALRRQMAHERRFGWNAKNHEARMTRSGSADSIVNNDDRMSEEINDSYYDEWYRDQFEDEMVYWMTACERDTYLNFLEWERRYDDGTPESTWRALNEGHLEFRPDFDYVAAERERENERMLKEQRDSWLLDY